MKFRKKEDTAVPPTDPLAWLIDSGFVEILLLHTKEVKFMAMFGYTFLHGQFLFPKGTQAHVIALTLSVSQVASCSPACQQNPPFRISSSR
jgi:hypothetical protein